MEIVKAMIPGLVWLAMAAAYVSWIAWDDQGQPAVFLFGKRICGHVVGRRIESPEEVERLAEIVRSQEESNV